MKCKEHPWYHGIYRHRTECTTCDEVYFDNHGMATTPIPTFVGQGTAARADWGSTSFMGALIDNWRSYIWVPSGEVIRGAEVAFVSTLMQALLQQDPSQFASLGVWLVSALLGAGVVALDFVKGKLPAKS